ncbi:C1 family peptidase, partial [Patescibacteria group bacterium]|nr:C1 family peptidase [Patescibacteria group bacterium]MBU4022865.1 C1 family peptidase [Patescibacteria group bacterium]
MSQVAKILTLALFCGCFLVASQASAASAVKPIYSMAVSGNITLNKIDGYARIILTDAQGKEYLMYEASGPFDSGSFSFENTCEETCVLNGIIPKKVDVEVLGAEIHIDKLLIIEDRTAMNTQVQTMGMQTYAEALDPVQEDVKIVKINQYIQNSGMKWTAGKTSVSEYSYEQKKVLFGIPINEELSNLQGFEYYTGGVFEIAGANASPKSASASNLPSSFDWRDRHGENWMTPVKNQNDPQEYGSCWAFSSIGTVEATANLHFNQQLNLDLSEQELVSCFPRSCDGLIPTEKPALIEHISSIGLIPETCFPYTATNSQCENKCQGWQNSTLKINNGIYINNDENEIKRTLIAEGPLWASSVYAIPGHAMILSGYDTNPYDNIPIWIFKNSWGLNWGEQGYLRTPSLSGILIQPEFVYIKISDNQPNYSNLKINCVNKDGDNYCNWGISETKPAVDCPSSCSENKKDCDDSNSNLGPFDLNYNCIPIGAGSPDKEPPYVGKIFVTPPTETFYKSGTYVFKVEIKDNQGISGCEFLDNEYPVGQMILDSPYCKHCYAEKEYWVGLTEGQKSLSARCWDKADNSSVGDVLEIEILPTVSPVVGTISPSAAIINQSQNFLASVSDDIGVTRCQLKINDASGLIEVAIMTLSDSPCVNCAASQSYSFSSDGNYSMRATCWDGDNNITEGPLVEIRVSSFGGNGELSVGKITPSTAQLNVRKRFSTMVSDDGEVLACALKINNTPVEYMNFSES